MTPRMVVPPLFWLVLSVASLVAAFGVWQSQRLERMRPPSVAAQPARGVATPVEAAPEPAPEPAGQAAPQTSANLPAPSDGASEPIRQLDPTAGRQVLRCVSKGRVTYRDLNAGCPEGAAERVTIFPTEGVGKPK